MTQTIYLSGGPVPHPLRVTAMLPPPGGVSSGRQRPPESGYSFAVPDTWARSEFNPHTAPWGDIWYKNTGWSSPPWESGGPAIGSGFTVRVPMQRHGVSGGMGPVEVGGDPGRWCCEWWEPWCSAEDCAAQDKQAQEELEAKYRSAKDQTIDPCPGGTQIGTDGDGSAICSNEGNGRNGSRRRNSGSTSRQSGSNGNGKRSSGTKSNGSGGYTPREPKTHLQRHWPAYLGAAVLGGALAIWGATR
jgi:hypothetical protein